MTRTMLSLATLVVAAVFVQGQVNNDQTRVPGTYGPGIVEAVVHTLSDSCIFPNDHRFLRRLAKVASDDGTDPNTYRFGYEGGIWQIDQADFRQTQTSALVAPYFGQIQQKFGINWRTVQWSDLRKPLYSGLAAMLDLVRIGLSTGALRGTGSDFPRTKELQSTFYMQYLVTGTVGADYNFLQKIKGISFSCGSDKIDLAFLVDESSSLSPSDFLRSKKFARDVVQDYGASVNANGVQVAFVTFGTNYTSRFVFNTYNNGQQIMNAIDNINKGFGSTNTPDALKYATDVLFQPQMLAGSRFDAAKIAIVLTDGESNDEISTAENAQKLRQLGIDVFVIGVGNDTKVSELNSVASKPQCTHVQTLDQYSELDSLKAEIRQVACDASVLIGPPTANNPIHTSNQCGKTNSFTIATAVETTITITPKSGFVQVFGSYSFSRPSTFVRDFTAVASSTRPVQIYIRDTSAPLYLTIQSDANQAGQCGSEYDLDLVFGDTFQKISEKVCVDQGLVRDCTPLDLLRALYQVVQGNPNNLGFVNPCRANTGGYGWFPYPNVWGRFVFCDLVGNVWLVTCNANQYYNDGARDCVFGQPPTPAPVTQRPTTPRPTTQRPTTRPTPRPTQRPTFRPFTTQGPYTASVVTSATGGVCSVCTITQWNLGNRFFAYPGNETLYIMCTEYVSACQIKQCAQYHKWNPVDKACVYYQIVLDWTRDQYQTSPYPSDYLCPPGLNNNSVFYHPHPADATKFVHCDEFGDAFVQSCKPGTIWNQYLMTCVPGAPHSPVGPIGTLPPPLGKK